MPARPALSDVADREWNRLAELAEGMKVLTVADAAILEATCLAYEEMTAARAAVAQDGRFYTTVTKDGSTMRRTHPGVAVAADAWRRWVTGLAHFGLSPASRGKVATAPAMERDDLELWLIDGGKKA